jgi:hypothetical protein
LSFTDVPPRFRSEDASVRGSGWPLAGHVRDTWWTRAAKKVNGR